MTNLQTQSFPQSNIVFPFEPICYDRNGEIIYPEQRETDMGEASSHNALMMEFLQALRFFLKSRNDIFVTGNMNVYYEEGNPRKWFAPDILVAFGVENKNRKVFKIWQEGIFPQVIFEIASETTYENDLYGEKFKLYETLGAEEYYLLDAERTYLPAPLMAFRRENGRLKEVQIVNNRVFSNHLGLEIVQTENNFRLFNPATQNFLFTLQESEAEKLEIKRRANVEIEKLKAEIEWLKGNK